MFVVESDIGVVKTELSFGETETKNDGVKSAQRSTANAEKNDDEIAANFRAEILVKNSIQIALTFL
ncbi:hypothetical protein G6705_04655 [Polynucleobacter paneuropaeus]|nr:hypothetical protein [Polynucleobacter paneuropaeus]